MPSDVRPIIIVGAERSGTSVCAELVHTWGAYVGAPEHLPRPDRANPRGRWEYGPLWDLLAEIGEFSSGVSWWDDGFDKRVENRGSDPVIADRARALIRTMEVVGRPWLWKDPALCHFLGFWRHFWRDPVFVVAVRHPLDVAISWQRMTADEGASTTIPSNLSRWQRMMLCAVAGTAADPTLFVEFERLVTEPEREVRRLARFLDTHCGCTTTAETLVSMTEVCEPQLWRNRDGRQRQGTSDSQRSLYEALRARARDATAPIDPTLFPMPDGWREQLIAEESAALANREATSVEQ